MAKLTLTDITAITGNEPSVIAAINNNNTLIENAVENTLSRDGTVPNTISYDIDMNSKDIINVNDIKFGTSTLGVVGLANASAASATAAGVSETNAAISAASALTSEGNAALSASKLVGTSTTSVVIGTGSRAFTTQVSKFFTVGQWLLVTSDADSTNYLHGQSTAYDIVTGALTINVTNIGGAGTLTDWTIRLSGTQGPIGLTGATGPTGPAGTGDVVGPAGATKYSLAMFADTTGKALQDGPALGNAGDVMTSNGAGALPSMQAASGGALSTFRANQTVVQTGIVDLTYTKVIFQTEDWDADNLFDNATNYRFTPTAGKWLLNAQVNIDDTTAGKTLDISIYKNGSSVGYNINITPGLLNRNYVGISMMVNANGTDYYEVFLRTNIGAGPYSTYLIGLGAIATVWFEGFKVS